MWNEHNERLLEIADREDEILFIDFDGGRSHIRSCLQLLAEQVPGLQYTTGAVEPYNEGLRTSDNQASIPNERIRRTYHAIRKRAASHNAAEPSPSSVED